MIYGIDTFFRYLVIYFFGSGQLHVCAIANSCQCWFLCWRLGFPDNFPWGKLFSPHQLLSSGIFIPLSHCCVYVRIPYRDYYYYFRLGNEVFRLVIVWYFAIQLLGFISYRSRSSAFQFLLTAVLMINYFEYAARGGARTLSFGVFSPAIFHYLCVFPIGKLSQQALLYYAFIWNNYSRDIPVYSTIIRGKFSLLYSHRWFDLSFYFNITPGLFLGCFNPYCVF